MAGNMIDLDRAALDLVSLRTDADALGQQLHDAAHHQDHPDDVDNVKAAADDVMQAWAKLTAASANLDAVRSARVQRARIAARAAATVLDTRSLAKIGGTEA